MKRAGSPLAAPVAAHSRTVSPHGARRAAAPQHSVASDRVATHTVKRCVAPAAEYYPTPIGAASARGFSRSTRRRPADVAASIFRRQQHAPTPRDNELVVHWLRADLRVADNTALARAVVRGARPGCRLACLYVINEHDWRAHLDGGWKIVFALRALRSLANTLHSLNVPLIVRKYNGHPDGKSHRSLSRGPHFAHWFHDTCVSLCEKGESCVVTANLQYEPDELQRDIAIAGLNDSSFSLLLSHDQCIVPPGEITTDGYAAYRVFAPWFKKWSKLLPSNAKERLLVPESPSSFSTPLQQNMPDFPSDDYHLPEEFTSYLGDVDFDAFLPEANEMGAHKVLVEFLKRRVETYSTDKDILIKDWTSMMSVYLTAGVISTRQIVNECARSFNVYTMDAISRNQGLHDYVREVAWRDFYRHVMCFWPYTGMELPFELKYVDMKWDEDVEKFSLWCEGKTGFPLVDAIMRKLLKTGYINNRSRMIVASFLSKNLYVDWRWGERWFRLRLMDFDLSSNVGGWGFCSSTGIDPQPYFRIFSVIQQAKKYDPKGEFIKKWVPELEKADDVISEKALKTLSSFHDYPTPLVDLKATRQHAIDSFKQISSAA